MSTFDPTHADWLNCVDRLYDAVGQEQQLSQALGAFIPLVDARSVIFLTIPDARYPATSHTAAVGLPEVSLVEYHTHFNVHDPWVQAAVKRHDFRAPVVYCGSDLVDRGDLQRSYYWRDFLQRFGVTDVLTALVEDPSTDGPATFVSFYRFNGQQPYVAADRDMLIALTPHLRRVLRLHRRIAPAMALGASLVDLVQRLDMPVLFIAADGQVVKHNPAAEAALREPLGLIRLVGGRLRAAGDGRWVDLSRSLDEVTRSGSLVVDLVAADGRCAALSLRLIQGAVDAVMAQHPAMAIATLSWGARDVVQALRQQHGLTAAEARVAMQLSEGLTPAQIAQISDVALTTIRTHIGSARAKLGVDRLAQLVARVLALKSGGH